MRLVLTLVLAAPLAAQQGTITRDGRYWVQTIESTVATPGLMQLRVSSVGSITVRGEAGDQVRYVVRKRVRAGSEAEARRRLEQAEVQGVRRGPAFSLTLDPRGGVSAEIEVIAPKAAEEVRLETHAGSLQIYDIDGSVTAETAGGSIQVDRIGKVVRAATAGGSITLGSVGGPVRCETAGGPIRIIAVRQDATLSTSGGDIDVEQVDGTLRAETAGGSIRAARVGGNVTAETAGGSIHVGRVGGRVSAETAGGSIVVESAMGGVRAENANGSIKLVDVAGAVHAATAAGNILAQLARQAIADSSLETSMGNIVVLIPDGLRLTIRANIDVATSLNRIQTDFPDIRVRMDDRGPGPRAVIAEGALNGGGPVLYIRNTTGTIQIKRR